MKLMAYGCNKTTYTVRLISLLNVGRPQVTLFEVLATTSGHQDFIVPTQRKQRIYIHRVIARLLHLRTISVALLISGDYLAVGSTMRDMGH